MALVFSENTVWLTEARRFQTTTSPVGLERFWAMEFGWFEASKTKNWVVEREWV